jgi:endonuclease III
VTRQGLAEVISALERRYGRPQKPMARSAFESIVFDNACYLVDDARREAVFADLKERIGTTPADILTANRKLLLEVLAPGGMRPPLRAEKLTTAAEIATEVRLDQVMKRPFAEARKELERFPGVALPGAQKLAMVYGGLRVLALESNGLRVLQRLGFGTPEKDYAKAYRSTQHAIEPELHELKDLPAAHALLRTHGQALCKATRPMCGECPLANGCPTARA